jgi:hypothetical protein
MAAVAIRHAGTHARTHALTHTYSRMCENKTENYLNLDLINPNKSRGLNGLSASCESMTHSKPFSLVSLGYLLSVSCDIQHDIFTTVP